MNANCTFSRWAITSKALSIDPANRRGLWARARLALTSGRYSDAIADFNAYFAQNPRSSDVAYYFRGQTYNHVKKYAPAEADLQVYVGRAASDPDGYRERAVALTAWARQATPPRI